MTIVIGNPFNRIKFGLGLEIQYLKSNLIKFLIELDKILI
jgi:hypothetical protein